jgi:transcriptional regulator with XRE-family HTH domain
MNEKQKREYPYITLGSWLKRMRQKKQESLEEVSGAVEIDSDLLSEIERGAKRPGEDILMLLISYFAVKEEDAVKVWEMAGYNKPDAHSHDSEEMAQPVLVMPMDVRIVYTDLAHVSTNKYGVTISFLQSEGIGNQPLAVSRVGMSHEHAKMLLETLEKSLRPKQQKLLPAPEVSQDNNKTV